MLGHLSYDCPKRQVQGKFTNVTRNSQPSYDEPGEGSSEESDTEELSERNYEKDEYEVEVQAFMARGQGERQERAEAREARRRREEEAAPAQPAAPVQPTVVESRTAETSKTEASSGGTMAEICAGKLDNPYWDAGGEKSTRSIWASHARPS